MVTITSFFLDAGSNTGGAEFEPKSSALTGGRSTKKPACNQSYRPAGQRFSSECPPQSRTNDASIRSAKSPFHVEKPRNVSCEASCSFGKLHAERVS